MLSDIGDPFAVGLPGGLPASLGGVTCPAAKGRPGGNSGLDVLRLPARRGRPGAAGPACGEDPAFLIAAADRICLGFPCRQVRPPRSWGARATTHALTREIPTRHRVLLRPAARRTVPTSLSPGSPCRALTAACLPGVPECRLARFHSRPVVALDAAQPRPAGRGARDPARLRDHGLG